MAPSPVDELAPEERAATEDFKTNIWAIFQPLYEEKWDQARWDAAVSRFRASHKPEVVQTFMRKARLPDWDALREQMKKGPPAFLRPGWKSPLLGQKVDLKWLDSDTFECVRPSISGWRDRKVLVIEYWASEYDPGGAGCVRAAPRFAVRTEWILATQPCHVVSPILSKINASKPDVKLITFNHEGIFNKTDIDRSIVDDFVSGRDDMDYPVYIDMKRVAVQSLFDPGQNLSIPLAFIITTRDQVVRWIGNPEDMGAPLAEVLRTP
ncbi:hypothetical protein WOLCODRAFT_152330 [Wolfiporia cocos MD-104 SS10]|uniref:Thioredoxin domain-containing protein n=1 Tax=Wolfiporia cocos (strain MD-104) TaxID=742152 RepID=A0A2H3JLA6_WOLCO|nr:hypothetical protein WOLCODRAFT_152330 [Wolfiporia cocos MD-104 SS10]